MTDGDREMCAANNPNPDEEETGRDENNSVAALLLAALVSGLPVLPTKNKADRIKRLEFVTKYGEQTGRFRETTGNIAAIDFGTTFCSLAFTVNSAAGAASLGHSETTTLKLNECFPRVPTAILLRQLENSVCLSSDGLIRTPQYRVAKFGYDAQEEHKKMRKEERARSLYFERFKMDLQKDMVSLLIILTFALRSVLTRLTDRPELSGH